MLPEKDVEMLNFHYKMQYAQIGKTFLVMMLTFYSPLTQAQSWNGGDDRGQGFISTTEHPPLSDGVPTGPSCIVKSKCKLMPDGLPFFHSNCRCDDRCKMYGDCCKDYRGRGITLPKPPKNTLTCKRVAQIDPNVELYISNSCPKDYTDHEIRENCEDETNPQDFLQTPVTGRYSQILYRNFYCALCAGETDVVFWKVELRCTGSPIPYVMNITTDPQRMVAEVFSVNQEFGLCSSLYFPPENVAARKCRSIISRCDRSWSDKKISKKCRSYNSHVYVDYTVFKNKYCAACNYVNVTYLNCIDKRTVQQNKGLTEDNYPFNLLFDPNDGKSIMSDKIVGFNGQERVEVAVDIEACPEGSIYDPFSPQCRRIHCNNGLELFAGQCVQTSVTPLATTPNPFIGFHSPDPEIIWDVTSTEKPDFVIVSTTTAPTTTTKATTTTVVQPVHTPKLDLSKIITGPPENHRNKEKEMGMHEYEYNLPKVEMNCPLLELKPAEFTRLPNDSIYVHSVKGVYNNNSYIQQGIHFYICTPYVEMSFSNNTQNRTTKILMFQFTDLQGLVSFVGILVSLVAMLIQFIVFMLLPPLRNTGGKCLISLVAALFCAQLLFLAGLNKTEMYYVCLSISAGLHYTILAAFFWINVMAIDVYKAFQPSKYHGPSDRQSKRFTGYSFYSWLCPAFIVGGCLAMEFLSTDFGYTILDEWRPHYADDYCWISNRNALLFLFALPLALLLAINIILYMCTIKNIYHVNNRNKLLDKNKERNRFILYVKLAFIMGFTWIFGFLATLTELRVLWYVFIAFNTLQGLFICLAFVCTKKVYKLLKSGGRVHRTSTIADPKGYYSNGSRLYSRPNPYIFTDCDGREVVSQETSI